MLTDQQLTARQNSSAPDLIAVTFVKCAPGKAQRFRQEFDEHLNRHKEFKDKLTGFPKATVTPRTIAATAGYFDYLIVIDTDSTEAISQFCLDVLRAGKMTELVVDTQTAVGVVSWKLQIETK